MTDETAAKLAAVRERRKNGEHVWEYTDIDTLLNSIDTLTAERDEANERRAETVAMCEQLTAELAAERADVVRWLRAKEESWVNRGVVASENEAWALRDSCYDAADAISSAADAIERGEHEKGGGDAKSE